MRASRDAITPDLQPRPSASSSLGRLSLPFNKISSGMQSSATWTSNSGDLGALSDTDEIGDRTQLTQEYNRLAQKACQFLDTKTEQAHVLTSISMAFARLFLMIPRTPRSVLGSTNSHVAHPLTRPAGHGYTSETWLVVTHLQKDFEPVY